MASCFVAGTAYSAQPVLPTGGIPIIGIQSITQTNNTLNIVTNANRSIANWNAFSVGVGAAVNISQPSSASAHLSKVVGQNPSEILGSVWSNGRFYLINPNGILFGAGAQIDVAGLVASSLNLSNEDFLANRLKFTNMPGAGSVINQGNITTGSGGNVYLVGSAVTNNGIIISPQGEVVLAAGNSVELVSPGTPNLRVEVNAQDEEARNIGQIIADAGRVGIYAGLVNQSGTIRANGASVTEDGRIVLKATKNATLEAGSLTSASGPNGGRIEVNAGDTTLVAGVVEAKGIAQRGGAVHVLGDKVGVHGNARVDASGEAGGGTVLVGGEFQGQAGVTAVEGAAIRNATAVFVGEGANVLASAGTRGDGGKVIVWADDTARVHGAIHARGGAQSGDGGFVETSGKLGLEVTRAPDVRAPGGTGGTWLLDPNDLDIVAGSGIVNNTSQPFFVPLTDSSSIGVDLINLQLDFGSNVVLTTTSAGVTAGTQDGNITILAPIAKTATGIGTTSLTLRAHNNIVIGPGGSIASTGDRLDVALQANNDFSGGGGVTVGGGGIVTNGGSVSISGADPVAINAIIDARRTTDAGSGGSVSLSSSAGTVNVGADVLAGSFFQATGASGVNISAPVTGNGVFLSASNGPVTVSGAVTNASTFSATAGGTGNLLTVAAPVTGTSATLVADDMEILSTVTTTGSLTVRQNTSGRPMNLGTNAAGSLSLTQAELSRLATGGGVTFGNTSTGAFTVSAPVSAGSTSVSMNSGTSFTVNPGASLTTAVPLSVNAPSMTIGGPVSAQQVSFTTDAIDVNAAVTSAADISIFTRSFGRSVNLGVPSDGTTSLDFTAAELNNLVTGASNALRIGSTSSGALAIAGPIAPAGTQNLVLSSGNGISQAAGATITVPNLALSGSGNVILPEANAVGTLAASLCCTGNTFTFSNASPLTIGSVAGVTGVSNFSNSTSAEIAADSLAITSFMQFGSVTIAPRNPGAVRLDLGGADAPGTLGISAADLANVFAGTLTLRADEADISAPVASSSGTTLVLAPATAGRALNIIGGPTKNPANLEFTPAEIGNVTASSLVLGDAGTGPVSVDAALTVPGSIGMFGLHSGDTTSGITVSQPLAAANGLTLIADTMAINNTVTASNGDLTVATSTAGTPIDLGVAGGPGTLGLDEDALSRLFAPNGTLFIGSSATGDISVVDDTTFDSGQIGNLNITSGTRIHVHGINGNSPRIDAPGAISLTAPDIVLDSTVTSAGGSIDFAADTMTVNDLVMSNGGDINIAPFTAFRNVTLGGTQAGELSLTAAALDNLDPGSGVLRIGDVDGLHPTGNITVRGVIQPADVNTLSLVTYGGTVSQSPGMTITVPNLAVLGINGISLTGHNDVGTVALYSNFGDVSFTHNGANPLNIGTVDGLSGIQGPQFSGGVTLISNELNIDSFINALNVMITPANGAQPITLGTKPGGSLGLTNSELDRIFASTLILGDSAVDVTSVTAPISGSGSFFNLFITSGSIDVSNSLTVPGAFTATADAMTFTDTISAASATLKQSSGTTAIDLGGADVISTTNTLGLDATDLGNLSVGALTIGDSATPSITVSAATDLGSTPTTLATSGGGTGTINVNAALGTTGNLTLTTDNLVIPGSGSVSAANVALNTVTAGRTIDLGTAMTGTALGLDQAQLDRISTPGTLAINATGAGTAGTINVSAPLAFVNAANLALSAGTMTVNGALSAPGAIALRANAMDILDTVSSTGGGRLSAAPRTSSIMTLGPTGSGLLLSATEIGQFSTSGVLQLGDTSTTSSMSISGPISQGSVGALTLAASGGISQTAGSTITASNLRVQSFSTVTLGQTNSVGTIAGSGGNFTFINNGLLNIGSVDGQNGISGSTVTLKGDTLAINQPISGSTVRLAPRAAGAAIDVGSKPGGVFGVSDAEIDLISASTLIIGENTSGPINVTAPVDRAFGNFNLETQPGSTINVHATFASPNSSVSMNAGAGGAINIGAQVTAFNNIVLTADNVDIGAPLVTTGSTVTIAPATAGLPVNVGTETAGALSLTAAELALIDTDILTIGSSSAGPLTVSVPFTSLTLEQLRLLSGGAITQNPGAVIILSNPSGGALQLSSSSGGVSMTEANSITGSLFGNASGAGSNFEFNNILPMRLQGISASAGNRVLVNGGFSGVLLALFDLLEGSLELPTEQVIIALNEINNINSADNAEAVEEKKEDKKDQMCR